MSTDVTTPVVAPPPPGDPARIGRRERFGLLRSRADTKVSPYLYIAPFFALFAIFGFYPLIYTGWVSLHDWQLASADHPWSGLDNYRQLVTDPVFWNSLWNTFGILFMSLTW